MVLKALVAAFCVVALRISSFFGVSDLPMCVEKTTAASPSTILSNVTSIPMSLPTNISFGPTSIGHKVSDLPTSVENATSISPTVLSPNVTSTPMSFPTNISFGSTGIPFPLPTNGSPSEDFVRRNMMRYFRGSDRTVELFQPKLNKEALTFVKEIKTYTSRSTPSKTFFDAINDIEVGVAQARTAGPRVRYSEKKIKTIKNTITLAVDKRMYQFARQRLGQALFLIDDHNSRRTSRSKRSTAPDTSSFIEDLKRSIGDDKFDKLMAVRGDVTLMFAIDTTGSMSDEIETAKRMAIDVVNYPRENPVNYILAPFSDPETGAVVFEENTNAAGFVKAISNLRASGGGDCPELTMTGILNAIYEGPDPGSPLYVFTDASAKDATDKNIRDVVTMAKSEDITINFYTTGSLCGKSIVDNPFLKIAEATSGQVLRLSGSGELSLLKSLTKSGIDESSTITSGSSRATRRKRSVGSKRYSIRVDDSAKSISISITTDNSNKGPLISLLDPTGVKVTSGKVSMSKASVYQITSPRVGIWTLVIPSTVGPYNFFVRSHGDKNIDFKYFFLVLSRTKPYEVPSMYPLIGQQTKVIIMLAGANKILKNTVMLELITRHGDNIQDVALTPDAEGVRYTATFTSPSRPFKLKIKGTTKSGNAFQRISRGVEEPKSVQLRILYSGDEFTLKRGEVSTVTFRLYNAARVNKMINIEVKDRLGYASNPRRNKRTLRKGRRAFFRIEFTTPRNASVGAKDTALVSLSVNNGEERVSMPVQLLVVE